MKTLHLFFIVFFVMCSFSHAADYQNLSQQTRERIRTQAIEMSEYGAPETLTQKMLTLMHQNQFQHQNIVQATQLIKATSKDDLPTKPVIEKALEGIAKKVPEDQVIRAMEAVRNRHTQAHRLSKMLTKDRSSNNATPGTIVDCLAAGMAVKDLDKIANQLQVRTRVQTRAQADELSLQTMQTVRTMSRMGGTTTDVSNTICKALDNQYSSQQMEQLRHRFVQQSQSTSGKQLANKYATGSLGKGGNDSGGSNASDGNSSSGGNSGAGGNSSSGGNSGSGSGGNGGNGGNGNSGGSR